MSPSDRPRNAVIVEKSSVSPVTSSSSPSIPCSSPPLAPERSLHIAAGGPAETHPGPNLSILSGNLTSIESSSYGASVREVGYPFNHGGRHNENHELACVKHLRDSVDYTNTEDSMLSDSSEQNKTLPNPVCDVKVASDFTLDLSKSSSLLMVQPKESPPEQKLKPCIMTPTNLSSTWDEQEEPVDLSKPKVSGHSPILLTSHMQTNNVNVQASSNIIQKDTAIVLDRQVDQTFNNNASGESGSLSHPVPESSVPVSTSNVEPTLLFKGSSPLRVQTSQPVSLHQTFSPVQYNTREASESMSSPAAIPAGAGGGDVVEFMNTDSANICNASFVGGDLVIPFPEFDNERLGTLLDNSQGKMLILAISPDGKGVHFAESVGEAGTVVVDPSPSLEMQGGKDHSSSEPGNEAGDEGKKSLDEKMDTIDNDSFKQAPSEVVESSSVENSPTRPPLEDLTYVPDFSEKETDKSFEDFHLERGMDESVPADQSAENKMIAETLESIESDDNINMDCIVDLIEELDQGTNNEDSTDGVNDAQKKRRKRTISYRIRTNRVDVSESESEAEKKPETVKSKDIRKKLELTSNIEDSDEEPRFKLTFKKERTKKNAKGRGSKNTKSPKEKNPEKIKTSTKKPRMKIKQEDRPEKLKAPERKRPSQKSPSVEQSSNASSRRSMRISKMAESKGFSVRKDGKENRKQRKRSTSRDKGSPSFDELCESDLEPEADTEKTRKNNLSQPETCPRDSIKTDKKSRKLFNCQGFCKQSFKTARDLEIHSTKCSSKPVQEHSNIPSFNEQVTFIDLLILNNKKLIAEFLRYYLFFTVSPSMFAIFDPVSM